jgi:hypothetical protein
MSSTCVAEFRSSTGRSKASGGLSWLLSLVFLVAVALGIKEFQIWDSVREFINYDPWVYLGIPWSDLTQNPWWIRTGVALPCLLVAEHTPLSIDLSFGLYATGTVLLASHLVNRTLIDLFGENGLRSTAVTFVMIVFGWGMNGRICFAFLGAAILYRAHLLWQAGLVSTSSVMRRNLIALAFMTVSTGAFYVGAAAVLMTPILGYRDPRPGPRRGRASFGILAATIPSLILIIHQGLLFNEKLARWHDGDYLMFLYHGPLKVMEKVLPSVDSDLALLGGAVAGVLSLVIWSAYFNTRPFYRVYMTTTLLAGICCGAFGWSTMFTNLPGALIAAGTVLSQKRSNAVSDPAPRTRLARRAA